MTVIAGRRREFIPVTVQTTAGLRFEVNAEIVPPEQAAGPRCRDVTILPHPTTEALVVEVPQRLPPGSRLVGLPRK